MASSSGCGTPASSRCTASAWSRSIALEETIFDEYWGGELDVLVPVEYVP